MATNNIEVPEFLLDVHHIDENRDNNSLDNLIVLCVYCHAIITRRRGVLLNGVINIEKDRVGKFHKVGPKRKVKNRPETGILRREILEHGNVKTSIKYGVRGGSLRRWIIESGMSPPRSKKFHRKKVPVRPTADTILDDLKIMSYTKVGEKYSVSDNAIRKWLRDYGVEPPYKLNYYSKNRERNNETNTPKI